MVDFPAVSASDVAKVLANNGPTPCVNAQSRIGAEIASLLPNGFHRFKAEWLAVQVSIWFPFHDKPMHQTFLCHSRYTCFQRVCLEVSESYPELALPQT